jgi:hypothetical protein
MMAAMSQDDVVAAQTTAGPAGKDWYVWHAPYAEAGSPLSRRLRLVQGTSPTGWTSARIGS